MRAGRLLSLLLILQDRRRITAAELARRLEGVRAHDPSRPRGAQRCRGSCLRRARTERRVRAPGHLRAGRPVTAHRPDAESRSAQTSTVRIALPAEVRDAMARAGQAISRLHRAVAGIDVGTSVAHTAKRSAHGHDTLSDAATSLNFM